EYGTVIRQQGEKLQFLLDSLVKISRLENGIIQTVPQKGELGELACQVKSLMEQKAGEKQISLEVKPGKEKVYAWFDRKWTREALMNLADNAVKYTPAGGKVTLEVVSYSLFSRIDVRDTGIGIEEEELPEIFQRFYRSRDVFSEEGVGLGLYLAREIVRSQGGYIKVSSKKGEGSVFSVFLPSEKRENVSRL
ncbi:MAG TPA: HAMP domain-containing histidine kinase, partial [Candidatus Blautia merdipullorum]|nr:HAMP domain-containing histidine kinase [Candidatus Blautia merdipullorum]